MCIVHKLYTIKEKEQEWPTLVSLPIWSMVKWSSRLQITRGWCVHRNPTRDPYVTYCSSSEQDVRVCWYIVTSFKTKKRQDPRGDPGSCRILVKPRSPDSRMVSRVRERILYHIHNSRMRSVSESVYYGDVKCYKTYQDRRRKKSTPLTLSPHFFCWFLVGLP